MNQNDSRQVWLYASVTGSIWASVEIILGSFLHNLHLPMSGTFLSLISVALLSASLQSWNVKGIIWRAAIICASMKSISPSAVILGPIVAIVMEGFLYEAVTRIAGRNIISLIIAGGVAASWSIIQKVVNLILVYGTNLIELYLKLYDYAVQKTGNLLLFQEPYYLLIFFVSIPTIGGMVSSAVGVYIGRRSHRLNHNCIDEPIENAGLKKRKSSTFHEPALWMLFLQLAAIIGGLTFIERAHVLFGFFYALIFILFNLLYYKGLYNKFKKPRIYITFAVLAFLTGFFLGGVKEGTGFTIDGAFIGLKMILRAFVMIIGFSVIGIELKHRAIKTFFYRLGFDRMQPAMEIAFLSLPFMMGSLQKIIKKTKSPFKVIECILASARNWIREYQNSENIIKPKSLIFITGSRHSGKTTAALKIFEELKSMNIPAHGFLTPGYIKNGSRSGFDIFSLATGKKTAFAIKGVASHAIRIGRFSIYEEGLRFGKKCIMASENSIDAAKNPVCFIDEIGPLEMQNKGWHESVLYALENYRRLILLVRNDLLSDVIEKYDINNFNVLEIINHDQPETGSSNNFSQLKKKAGCWFSENHADISNEKLHKIIASIIE